MSSNSPIGPKKPEYTSLEKYLSSDSGSSTEGVSAAQGGSKMKHVKSILNTKLSRLGHLMKTFFQPGKHAEWVNDKEIFARLENRIKTLEEYKKSGKDFRQEQMGLIDFIATELNRYSGKVKKGSSNSEKLEELKDRMQPINEETTADIQRIDANKGNVAAQRRLGMMYLHEWGGVRQSYENAAEYFKLAADAGDAVAQYELGMMYRLGKGVDESFGEAFKYTMKAAQQGHAAAQNELGAMYKEGIGTEKSVEEALKWFQLAADQGNARGQYNLAKMYKDGVGVEQSDGKAFEYIEKAAVQGLAAAESTLGEIYYKGLLGQAKDLHEAAKWFRRAAAQGDANAHYYLGELYKGNTLNDEVLWRGDYQTKDRIMAGHYREAANNGHPLALFNLGTLYLNGRGVEKSDENARNCFLHASMNQNLPEGMKVTVEMAVLYADMRILASTLEKETDSEKLQSLKAQAEVKIQQIKEANEKIETVYFGQKILEEKERLQKLVENKN